MRSDQDAERPGQHRGASDNYFSATGRLFWGHYTSSPHRVKQAEEVAR